MAAGSIVTISFLDYLLCNYVRILLSDSSCSFFFIYFRYVANHALRVLITGQTAALM